MGYIRPVFVLLALLACASVATAQEEWEGKEIRTVDPGEGWVRQRFPNFKSLLKARAGQKYNREFRAQDYQKLYGTGLFAPDGVDIQIKVVNNMLDIVISVKEFDFVENVEFRGHTVFSTAQLGAALRTTPGGYYNPANIKADKDAITEMYVSKGHHFFSLREEAVETRRGRHLIWHINEGPMVSIESIEFSGNANASAGDLKEYLLSKENDYLLFIPIGKNPFIERNLREDVERIKLWYTLEGWLDVYKDTPRPHVFVEDVVFNDAKTSVRIRFHVEEGRRYKIRNIRIKGNTIYPEQEIRSWLLSKVGDYYTEKNAGVDVNKIKDKYGERAYILAEVTQRPLFDLVGEEIDLQFEIKENAKVNVGLITVTGNTKTREDVIRRELTRAEFLPGEEYNTRKLQRGIHRLRGSGWFGAEDPTDPSQGVTVKNGPSDFPDSQDVTVEVKEAQTGNVRFAAGYSSAFGILGVLELTQRNFDISDLPKSLADLIEGTGFAGGGQFLRLRLAPAAKRQSFVAEFKEPYFFGYDLGFGVRAYSSSTTRESWDERRTGGSLSFDKPLDPFRLELTFGGYEINIRDVDFDAPSAIQDLEGSNTLISLTAGLTLDTRNSSLFPSEGARISLTYELAGQIFGGDFDFDKYVFDSEFYYPIFETETKLKHVLSLQLNVGWAEPKGDSETVPTFERFYAGGRGSIRGFEFRGVGPQENGDPVGGLALFFMSVEYTFPLFTKILRGAVFWDIANLTLGHDEFFHTKFRNTIGVGVRFMIPQLSNIPVAIDFGFPMTKEDEDDRQTITFDIGRLF